jgi:hypothetical protein
MAGGMLLGISKAVNPIRYWRLWLFNGPLKGVFGCDIGHEVAANLSLIEPEEIWE